MSKKFHDLFASPAPTGLDARIMARVNRNALRTNRTKAIAGSIATALFAAALILAGETVMETAMSGFGNYLSLIFTDGGVVLSDWRDFVWTLAESAPVAGLALCLGATGMLAIAVRWTGQGLGGRLLIGRAAAV